MYGQKQKSMRPYLAERIQARHEAQVKEHHKAVLMFKLLGDNLHLLPEWYFDEEVRDNLTYWWGNDVKVSIPWNPMRLQRMINECKTLGWKIYFVREREPGDDWMRVTLQHDDLKMQKPFWSHVDLDITMRAYAKEDVGDEEQIPLTQNCRKVQIGEEEQTKLVPIFDVICEESYEELLSTVGGD